MRRLRDLGEHAWIARLVPRLAATAPGMVRVGPGDDAAVVRSPRGPLVLTTDTLVEGVHFRARWTTPRALGRRAFAVNASDLAAMGATPAWSLLSLSLPQADAAWLDAFLDGFLALAQPHELALVGGDTTRGPLALGVTAMGFVPVGRALRRCGAQVGDEIWITGVPGEAAAALQQWREGAACAPDLRARLDRPIDRPRYLQKVVS